jgi:hypothetical protein
MDTVFVAQRDYLPAFAGVGPTAPHWLPLWAPDDLPPPAPEKTHAVAFVGRLDPTLHPERVALMETLRSRLPLHAAEGPYAQVFTRSHIVLNQTVRGDLNARVFEAMACGALLLTERTGNGLLDLFADGEDLVTYPRGDVEAVVAAAERWLAADGARAAIAERGRARVLAAHLEHHRAETVMARLATPPVRRPAPIRHAGVARACCVLAHQSARLAALFPGRPRFPALRGAYLAAADAVVRRRVLDEPDQSALEGALALERGEVPRALDRLGWAVAHGARPEDHLLRIEALVRAGDLGGARAAGETLCATHPGYDLARDWQTLLTAIAGDGAGAERPA